MTFVEREDVLSLVEELYCRDLAASWPGVELPRPFPRLPHAEAMLRYGSDKPDLRYGLEIARRHRRRARVRSSASSAARPRPAACVRALAAPGRGVVLAQGPGRADRVRQGVGRQGARLPALRGERRGALADRQVPDRGRDRRDPRGHRRAARLRRRSWRPTRPRSSCACSARCARTWPGSSSLIDRGRLGVPLRGRLPAARVERRRGALGGRAPHVHGARARARAPARERPGRRRAPRPTTSS